MRSVAVIISSDETVITTDGLSIKFGAQAYTLAIAFDGLFATPYTVLSNLPGRRWQVGAR